MKPCQLHLTLRGAMCVNAEFMMMSDKRVVVKSQECRLTFGSAESITTELHVVRVLGFQFRWSLVANKGLHARQQGTS